MKPSRAESVPQGPETIILGMVHSVVAALWGMR